MIRKSVTFYDDQYNFYKAFKSQKLLVAFVEFMFEDIEPEGLSEQEQILFDSLVYRMNNQKKKSHAGSIGGKKSKGGGRPKKSEQKQTENKQRTSKKQTKKQAKNKEDKDILSKDNILSISISNNTNNNLISKDIKSETKVSGYGNPEINKCLELISSYNGGIVDGTKQNGRRYSKLLIDKLNKLEKVKSGEFSWYETLGIILNVISNNKYYASKITSPENIYRNLSVLMQQCKADIGKATASSIILPTI